LENREANNYNLEGRNVIEPQPWWARQSNLTILIDDKTAES